MKDPDGYTMWVRYDGTGRRTIPSQVQLQCWGADEDDFDLVDLEDAIPLPALQPQCHLSEESL
eukprot:1507977-Prorocentrum_lima.AAC.1